MYMYVHVGSMHVLHDQDRHVWLKIRMLCTDMAVYQTCLRGVESGETWPSGQQEEHEGRGSLHEKGHPVVQTGGWIERGNEAGREGERQRGREREGMQNENGE